MKERLLLLDAGLKGKKKKETEYTYNDELYPGDGFCTVDVHFLTRLATRKRNTPTKEDTNHYCISMLYKIKIVKRTSRKEEER